MIPRLAILAALLASCATVQPVDTMCSEQALTVIVEGCEAAMEQARETCALEGIPLEECIPFRREKVACLSAIGAWELCK